MVMHTDYGALGCGKFEAGDRVSGHRPETTCPECRENLIREGGMREGMFYLSAAELEQTRARLRVRPEAPQLVHLLQRLSDPYGICGASLYSPDGLPNFSTLRADATCAECLDLLAEQDFDRAHE